MSQTHEEIVDLVIIQWSRENRGRLFKNHVGSAYTGQKINDFFKNGKRLITLQSASRITYGLKKGSSDLIGYEYVDGITAFCCVEVKTLAAPKIKKEQRDWLNNIDRVGGKAYIAKENFNGYDLIEWSDYVEMENSGRKGKR